MLSVKERSKRDESYKTYIVYQVLKEHSTEYCDFTTRIITAVDPEQHYVYLMAKERQDKGEVIKAGYVEMRVPAYTQSLMCGSLGSFDRQFKEIRELNK